MDNKTLEKVTRLVVVYDGERLIEKWDAQVELSLQDEGRTLKVFYKTIKGVKKMEPMKKLQKTLITKIGEQLEAVSINIALLDTLNRLLETVSNSLIAEHNKR